MARPLLARVPAVERNVPRIGADVTDVGCGWGTVIGGTSMASSLGMALGPVVGGLIYDTFSSYAWLFIDAFSLGVGAFPAALAFTRLPRRVMAAAVA